MAGADFGRNGGEFHRQFFDQDLAHRSLDFGRKLGAADQAGAVQADIEIGEDISRLQAARPFFHRIEMSGGIGAADHGADRGSDHDVGDDSVGHQRPDDADMGKAARGAAAQRQSDHRPAMLPSPTLSWASEPFWPRPIQLSNTQTLLRLNDIRRGATAPESSIPIRRMVYARPKRPRQGM